MKPHFGSRLSIGEKKSTSPGLQLPRFWSGFSRRKDEDLALRSGGKTHHGKTQHFLVDPFFWGGNHGCSIFVYVYPGGIDFTIIKMIFLLGI